MKILKCVQRNLCWHIWVIRIDFPAMSAPLSLLSAGSRRLLTHVAGGDLPPSSWLCLKIRLMVPLFAVQQPCEGSGPGSEATGLRFRNKSTNGETMSSKILNKMSGGKWRIKEQRTRNKRLFPSVWAGWHIYCNFLISWLKNFVLKTLNNINRIILLHKNKHFLLKFLFLKR